MLSVMAASHGAAVNLPQHLKSFRHNFEMLKVVGDLPSAKPYQ